MGDEDDLPLAALARQSKRRQNKKKQTRKSRSASPNEPRSKSPSPKRKQQKPKRAILTVYNLDGQFLGDVRSIADFAIEHRKEVPTKVGFVL